MELAKSRIGDYRVLGHWSSGAVSHVYLARREEEPNRGRLCTLKVPRTEYAVYAASKSVFLRGEARGPDEVHPNTVSTREVLDRNGRLYMVTDFVHGEPLSKLLRVRPGARWPVPLALAAALDLARALEFIQTTQKGSPRPHAEVCPSNIVVGYDGVVRLLDSGIIGREARTVRDGYLAPEQAAELPDLDGRCDVHGVGLVLWELLTGRRALQGNDPTELKAAALEGRIPAPSAEGAPTDASVDDVVMTALAVGPAQRHPSATALAEALQTELRRLAPEEDLRPQISKLLMSAFPAGAERLDRLLERWTDSEPNPAALEDPEGPLAAIRGALHARRNPPPRAFADPANSYPPPTQSGPTAFTDDIPFASASFRRTGRRRQTSNRRTWLLWGATALGLAVAGATLYVHEHRKGFVTQAKLRLATKPSGAQVSIDGQVVGRSPLTLSDLTPNRSYALRIELDGYERIDRTVTYPETGGTRTLNLELSALPGRPAADPEEELKDNPF